MKVQIDIENSRVNDVTSIYANLIKYNKDNLSVFDISGLSKEERKLLEDAINPKLSYTDIELFFIGDSNTPYYGPDYNYKIKDNRLYLDYIRKKYVKKEEELNDDWTVNFDKEFAEIVLPFIKSKNKYILVYYDNNELKCIMYEEKPNDNIFMDMFFENGYQAIALFKKNDTNDLKCIRNNLEFINSYCEDDKIYERR